MAITRRTHGAATAWTTSQPIPYSGSATAGDVCYLVALNTATIGSAPAGWTAIATGTANGYSMAIFKKDAVYAGGDGQPTVTASGGSGGVAWIEHFYSSTGGMTIAEFDPQVALDTTTGSTAFSATGSSETTLSGDWLVGWMGLKSSATMSGNATSVNLNQTGATVGTAVGNFGARLTGASPTNSLYYNSYTRPVTTGATGTPTFTATAGTGGANAAGPAGLMHIREVSAATDYTKTPADDVDLTDSATHTADVDRSDDDAVGITDSVTALISLLASGNDAVGVTDSASFTTALVRTGNDALGLADLATYVTALVRTPATEALGITDSVTAILASGPPTYVDQGGAVVVTTTAPPSYPAGIADGDLAILYISSDVTISDPTPDWTEVGTPVSSGGLNVRTFTRPLLGTESGAITPVVTAGGTRGLAWIAAYRPAGGGTLVVDDVEQGLDTDSSTTAYSATGSSWSPVLDDRIVAMTTAAATATFSGIATGVSLTNAGATVSATARFAGRSSGNTLYYGHVDAAVTAGGSGAPTLAATTAGGNGTGITVFLKVHENDGAAVNKFPADAVGLTDSASWSMGRSRDVADAVGITDAALGSGIDVPATFRAAADGQVSGATISITLTIPGTVQADDYGIIVTVGGNASGNPTTPSGWTWMGDWVSNGGGTNMSIFRRRFVAGDANPVVTWASAPGSGNNLSALAFWYTGVSDTPVLGTVLTQAATTVWPAPSVTTSGPNRAVVAISVMKGGGSGFPSSVTWSSATSRANRYATGNYFGAVAVADRTQSSAGATGTETATWNYSTASGFAVQMELPSGAAIDYTKTPADPVSITDSVTAEHGAVGFPADPVGITDTVSVVRSSTRSLADAVAITDTGDPQRIDVGWDVADAIGVQDAPSRAAAVVQSVADTIGLTDDATWGGASAASFSGTTPEVTGSFEADLHHDVTLTGVVPAIVGSLVASHRNPAALSGATPAVTGSLGLSYGGEPIPLLIGTTPALIGSLSAAQRLTATVAGAAPGVTGALAAGQTNPAVLAGVTPTVGGAPLVVVLTSGSQHLLASLHASTPAMQGLIFAINVGGPAKEPRVKVRKHRLRAEVPPILDA